MTVGYDNLAIFWQKICQPHKKLYNKQPFARAIFQTGQEQV